MSASTFHTNQIASAKEIFSKFSSGESNYDMLYAQMQSGKTGVSLYLAFQMLKANIVPKVYIISGNSEIQLRKQWEAKIKDHVDDYLKNVFYGHSPSLDEVLKLQARLTPNIEVIWRQDLMKNQERFHNNYLIIWDESHFATTEGQTLHQFFNTAKLMGGIQGNTSYMREKNIFISSVTATRCAEQSRHVHHEADFTQTIMKPGESYRGLEYFKAHGLVKESHPFILDKCAEISSILERESSKKKYMVVRVSLCTSSDELMGVDMLKHMCKERGIDYIEYVAATQESFAELWDTEPTKFTIVRVAGLFRMGKELNKQHIGAVYESSSTNHNTLAQGLLGRTCGYHQQDVTIYLPKKYIETGYEEYLEIIKSDHTLGMTKTRHVKGRKFILKNNGIVPQLLSNVSEFSWPTHPGENEVCDGQIKSIILEQFDFSKITHTRQAEYIRDSLNTPWEHGSKTNISFRHSHSERGKGCYKPSPSGAASLVKNINHNIVLTGSPQTTFVLMKIDKLDDLESGTLYNVGDIIVMCYTGTIGPVINGQKVETTNGKDIHHTTKTLDKDDKMSGQTHNLRTETYTDCQLMKESLSEAILKSQEKSNLDVSRCIKSNGPGRKTIMLSKDAYPNGLDIIIRELESEHNVKITTTKPKGRKPVSDDIRLGSIKWE